MSNLADHIVKTIVKAQYIPDNIPYTAMCFRNWEGDCLAFFNKPEFVFPCDEEKAKTLPIQKALPGDPGELALLGMRKALRGERSHSIVEVEHGGRVHEMHRHFVPYTEEISVVMLRNPLNDGHRIKSYQGTCQQLSHLYQSRTSLTPTDPYIVFWIDREFVIRDQRYQPNILLRSPGTPCSSPRKIEEELPRKEAKIVEDAVAAAFETRAEQHFHVTVLKQCCWVTEDCTIFYLDTNLVMLTVSYIRSICTKFQHLSLYDGMPYLPEHLPLIIPSTDPT